jgi:hypothetical protein
MATTTFQAPTAKQISFYNTLAAERGLPTIEAFDDFVSRKDASAAIDALMKIAKTTTKTGDQLTFGDKPTIKKIEFAADTVPAGHYAVTGEDGTTDFYKVNYGKPGGKWDGFCFIDNQQGPNYQPVKNFKTKAAIYAKIAADPAAASKRYGIELGVCGVCHTTLTNPESIEAGIGPVCAGKMGW